MRGAARRVKRGREKGSGQPYWLVIVQENELVASILQVEKLLLCKKE
jgi:hypothetical protein